ncbi:hypothetical protein [Streptomyces lunaelactis]|uniref:hypothetical protein n=1 Tax=Streptomyces lunaelactis TaxID=1535768 RepID=UPI0015845433|nr:hypothetical protein [Streptomyces lunaelactis]NUK05762.1 hypothetical protein [Streptomyces lunaelactis]NUK20228.1 hypothetical protein [Streptomyces lunaelactis]
MDKDEIRDDLVSSAQRWARTSIDAYLQEPADQDFAVHHMAVAVEHLAKACLASITLTLLADIKPSLEDLLLLGGREDKVEKGRAGLRTVSGAGVVMRLTKLGKGEVPQQLAALREARNGVTHMGWGKSSNECRELLASGVKYIDSLLPELAKEPDWFWDKYYQTCKSLVEETTSELTVRYSAKIQRAQETFASKTDGLSDSERTAVIASLAAAPLPSRWLLHVPTTCPACGNPAFISGRDKSGDYGDIWFFPRYFGCRVCDLTLTGPELDLADMRAHSLRTEEEVDDHWEPDFDLM